MFNYEEWDKKYHNEEVIDLKDYLNEDDFEIIHMLGIKTHDKIYTRYEVELLKLDLLDYFENTEEDLSKVELAIEKEYKKSLEGTGVTREEYNNVLEKVEIIELLK